MEPAYVFALVHLLFAYKLLFWSDRTISLGTWVVTVSLSACATFVFVGSEGVLGPGASQLDAKALIGFVWKHAQMFILRAVTFANLVFEGI